MARRNVHDFGDRPLDAEGLLLRAALLAGHGAEAPDLASSLAALLGAGEGRSCVEAGGPLQLSVDAPGRPELRVGVRLGERVDASALAALVSEEEAARLRELADKLPAAVHESLGYWLFWSPGEVSLFADLRDPDPRDAARRLEHALDADGWRRFTSLRDRLDSSRPWGVSIESSRRGLERRLYWLLDRHASPEAAAETLCPGQWPVVVDTLRHLLRRPGRSGRWLFSTSLDEATPPQLMVGNSGWTLVPEDDQKHRAVGRLMAALGGPRDYAEALWSLCRGRAAEQWKVGRACEVTVGPEGTRARLLFTPQVR